MNNAEVSWATESGGSLTLTANDSYEITVDTPNIEILKEQRNFSQGGTYTTNDIEVAAGEIIYYRLTVTSNGASPAYNISLEDILSDSLSYIGIVSGPSIGTVTPPNPPPAATLVWDIPSLNNGDTATLEFSAEFTDMPGSGENIVNQAEATYETSTVNPEEYSAISNEVDALAPHLQLVKTASKTVVNVGDTLTYVLTLTVPANVTAYDVVVSDTLPAGQSYAGNAKRNFFAVTPTVVAQTVTFDLELEVGPYNEDTVIVYSFNATVDSATPPYPEIQTNTAEVNWDTTPGGDPAEPTTSNVDIEVNEEPPYRGISIEDTENINLDENINWK